MIGFAVSGRFRACKLARAKHELTRSTPVPLVRAMVERNGDSELRGGAQFGNGVAASTASYGEM